MSKDNVIRFPGKNDSIEDEMLDGLLFLEEEIPEAGIDLSSSNYIRVDKNNIETVLSAVPALAVGGSNAMAFDTLEKLPLFTLSNSKGLPLSASDLIKRQNGSYLGMTARADGRFREHANLNPVDGQLGNAPGINIAGAIWAVMAAVTQKKFLSDINKNLMEIWKKIDDIDAFLKEQQRSKVRGAIENLKDIDAKKEAIKIPSPQYDTALVQLGSIKGIAAESRAFYETMVQSGKAKYSQKAKNKTEKKEKERIKAELLCDYAYYLAGHELHASAEMLSLYFECNPEYIEKLKNDFENREKEISETRKAVEDVLKDQELKKLRNRLGLALTNFECKFDQTKTVIKVLRPGKILGTPGGYLLERAIGKGIGIDSVERSQHSNDSIKRKAEDKAKSEVDNQIGNMSKYIESLDKMQAMYNNPLKIVQNQDEYYLVLGEKAAGD